MFNSFVINYNMPKADQISFYLDGISEEIEMIIDNAYIKLLPVNEGTCLNLHIVVKNNHAQS